jgi:hypothetical protein
MKKSVMAALSVAALTMVSVLPLSKASAADPDECELLAGALCSAVHMEGSPSWKACVLDYMQRNCPASATIDTSDLAAFRLDDARLD